MKENYCVYVVGLHPIFNINEVKSFEQFQKIHSSEFYKALLYNNISTLNQLEQEYKVVYCFDIKDQSFVESDNRLKDKTYFYTDTTEQINTFTKLKEKYFSKFSNNFLVFFNSIGYTANDLENALNLLAIEDDVFVIGKTKKNVITYVGFNAYIEEIFKHIDFENFNYDNFLSAICKENNLVHVIENGLNINHTDDFKQLYEELSKKESIRYCNDEIHELFTNVFIEYKEILK